MAYNLPLPNQVQVIKAAPTLATRRRTSRKRFVDRAVKARKQRDREAAQGEGRSEVTAAVTYQASSGGIRVALGARF